MRTQDTYESTATLDTKLSGRATEIARLERLLVDVRNGRGATLVLRGSPGSGKTALLDHAAGHACGYRIVRARGSRSEVDFPYAGLNLLCSSLPDEFDHLGPAQREILEPAIGLGAGARPDRFRVGVAALALLSAAAAVRPVLCVVDDAQWLDGSSAWVLAFVARRLETVPAALLVGRRHGAGPSELDGLPELPLEGLCHADGRTLVTSRWPGPVDDAVVERIVVETRGNPRMLLDAVHGTAPRELAGGFGVTGSAGVRDRISHGGWQRVERLPSASRMLLLAAAADPVGDPALHWRVAAELGIPARSVEQLESEGLLSFDTRVTFRDPSLRALVYGLAPAEQRRRVHQALAAATDPGSDPERHAWHHAHALEGPDEPAARELARQATGARRRGGPAAAAAFLAKAAALALDPGPRAERALAAAAAEHEAGAPESAVRLLGAAELGPPDESRRARVERLRARITFGSTRGYEAAESLLRAARRLEPVEPELARETYLEALVAAIFAGRLDRDHDVTEIARAARAFLPAEPSSVVDLLLEGFVIRCAQGYADAVESLKLALKTLRCADDFVATGRPPWLACLVAWELWDDDAWHFLAAREARSARDTGARPALPWALTQRALINVLGGDFAVAAALADEAKTISEAVDAPPFAHASLVLAGWRGREQHALQLRDDACRDAQDRGEGLVITTAGFATAVLYNGLGRYDEALVAARQACEREEPGLLGWSLVELIEAAARCGESRTAALALDRLAERTSLSGTDWALGIEARSRALLHHGQPAEDLYREAIERLERTRIRAHLARAHLVYGEWLRRQGRRVDARIPLRTAQQAFVTMGAEAFAERARRELRATGERARRRVAETGRRLTPQERRIAMLARDGLTNPQIGSRLFVSPRTVEYHLHKVFGKLDITSRAELHLVLANPGDDRRRVAGRVAGGDVRGRGDRSAAR